ncbi:MAG: MotA/TolQ/ExbB proton channel family protein [Opitutaceae bacterium]
MNHSLSAGLRDLLSDGGFVMPPLILLSIVLFTCLFRLVLDLRLAAQGTHPALPPIARSPDPLPGGEEAVTLLRESIQWRLHFDRRTRFVRILAATAPLLGLLGTVAGMLKTFSAMSLREGLAGGDFVAAGISEALITTETGLSIAIVGLVSLWAVRAFGKRLLFRFESFEASRVLAKWPPPSSC